MHPADAQARQIEEGDTVRQGVLVLPVGSWLTRDPDSGLDLSGNPNVLTPDIPTSAFGQGPSAQTCMVHLEAVAADPRDSMEVYQQEIETLFPRDSG
ncbi:Trimethylamine-N-oxide reductase 1 precursor (plasmid) [Sulfitobacter sp. THAF37]|nr:Trimethylamine-N-oxide reductase 1 precursor [Sulfitobacter sp. THAF37]